jgi:hypothetical protein
VIAFSKPVSVALEMGVVIHVDANTRVYEKTLSSEDIVFDRGGSAPASVDVLKTALARHGR